MDFLFVEHATIDKESLRQGDLLHRTPELARVVRQAHWYYADTDDYTHFVVLTQSCELVRRGKAAPQSRYITVAAVRPLSIILSRMFSRHRKDLSKFNFPIEICPKDRRQPMKDALLKLLHSDHDDLFLIREGSCPTVRTDSCIFPQLAITLRAQHYDTCLQAKVGQLKDIYAAKLGETVGRLYARVATPELSDELVGITTAEVYETQFIDAALSTKTVWLSQRQITELVRILEDRATSDTLPNTTQAAEQLLSTIPLDGDFVISRVLDVLISRNLLAEAARTKAQNVLRNDKELSTILRTSTR